MLTQYTNGLVGMRRANNAANDADKQRAAEPKMPLLTLAALRGEIERVEARLNATPSEDDADDLRLLRIFQMKIRRAYEESVAEMKAHTNAGDEK